MTFQTILIAAQAGNQAAQERIVELYKPFLTKEAVVDGVFDEDLFQELCEVLLHCIRNYHMDKYLE